MNNQDSFKRFHFSLKSLLIFVAFIFCAFFLTNLIFFQTTEKDYHDLGKRIITLTNVDFLYNTKDANSAIKLLKSLAEFGGGYPEENDAKELIAKYTKAEKTRKNHWVQYRKFKKKKKWSEAARILEELKNIHTPRDRRKQQDEIAVEEKKIEPHIKKIEPHIKILKTALASWNAQLEAFKQKIHNYYRKKSQDPLNLLRVEENIAAINNITISKLIDSERVRQDLKDAKEFAEDMKHNVAKRRYDIFEGPKHSEDSKRDLQLKCIKYRREIEKVGKLGEKGELFNLTYRYLQNKNGFIEKFSKLINENNPETCKEPIAELYGLSILLEELNGFIDLIENPPAETTLNLLRDSPFLLRLKALRNKVKKDYESLYGQSYKNKQANFEIKYSTALEEMIAIIAKYR